MPFPRRLLNDYESVVLDLHPHWWYYAKSAASTFVATVLALWVQMHLTGWARQLFGYIALSAVILAAAWLAVDYIKWRTTYFVLTSHRLIYREGIVGRHGVEIPLERVNNVNFHQTMWQRLIGVGDLLIESGGEDGESTFTHIGRPEHVQNLIHASMQARLGGRFEAAPSSSNIADQLERLEALRDRGTLTDDEFEEQKRRLLG
jgi:uncharacterized membrane protein YdbT with pleckstrin-like domain